MVNETPSDIKVCLTDAHKKNPNVTVALRIRPRSDKEELAAHRTIVKALDEHVVVFDPSEEERQTDSRGRPVVQRQGIPSNFSRARDCRYAFDCVFEDDSTQDDVYRATAEPLIESVLNGFNATVFAYGATGAGKTHTMIGNDQAPGVMVLTMQALFARVAERRADQKYQISMNYLEVYNETIRDLFIENSPALMLCENKDGVSIKGLTSREPASADEVLELLTFGNRNRRQAPTNANATSSRSHAVLQITVKASNRTAATSQSVGFGKLSLIDLAGSERAAATENRGARLKEGANINKSLLALGNCINALGTNKKGHVPFRNSKLTRILQDSLGGNCRTVMIANISPSSLSAEDTHNTLKYANRAKNIKTTVERNVVNVNFHVSRYVEIIKELTSEVDELKAQLEAQHEMEPRGNLRAGTKLPPRTPGSRERMLEMEVSSLKTQLARLESNSKLMWECARQQQKLLIERHALTDAVLQSYEDACSAMELTFAVGPTSSKKPKSTRMRRFGTTGSMSSQVEDTAAPKSMTPPASPSHSSVGKVLTFATPLTSRSQSSVELTPPAVEEEAEFNAFTVAASTAHRNPRNKRVSPKRASPKRASSPKTAPKPAQNSETTKKSRSPRRRSQPSGAAETKQSPRKVEILGSHLRVTTSPAKKAAPLPEVANEPSSAENKPALNLIDAALARANAQAETKKAKRIGGQPASLRDLSRPTAASMAKVRPGVNPKTENIVEEKTRIPKPRRFPA